MKKLQSILAIATSQGIRHVIYLCGKATPWETQESTKKPQKILATRWTCCTPPTPPRLKQNPHWQINKYKMTPLQRTPNKELYMKQTCSNQLTPQG